MKSRVSVLFLVALFSWSAPRPLCAQPAAFNVVYSFTTFQPPDYITNTDGSNPEAALIISGGTLYGTANQAGAGDSGTVFRVNTDGSAFTNLHSFTTLSHSTNSDGAASQAPVFLSGNTLYGTTYQGGAAGVGSVFAVNTDASGFTNLHSFTALTGSTFPHTNSDGAHSQAGLVLSGNTLFGTTLQGGVAGYGTVFAVNTDGSGFTNLHVFTAPSGPSLTNSDGANPYAGLILSGNTLYGTASQGGSAGYGAVFAISTDGSDFTNLYSFSGVAGEFPQGALVLSGNTLYGTTESGLDIAGTVFRVNTDGSNYTNLYSFTNGNDGANPMAGLALSGNTLYGTAYQGGSGGEGTAFSVKTDGSAFTVLHSFTPVSYSSYPNTNSDGAQLYSGLIISGYTLYGTASLGGTGGDGTIFTLTLPGPPPVGIAPAGDQIVISWPASATNFMLQSATDLSSRSWSNITSGIVTAGTNCVFTNTPAGPAAFFRLQQQ